MRPFSFVSFPAPSAKLSAIALAVLTGINVLPKQSWATEATLPTVVVQSPALREAKASISGWGDTPAWQAPVQALSLQAEALQNAQVQRLADVVKLDASTTDAYNTTGYWDYLSIRGFTLDNASNYRREGLPINAETRIGLENKSAIELLKGTSGLQAGISAPGGLVNYLVKRPEGRIRQAEVALTGGSSIKSAIDLSDRFGAENQFGLRLNAATQRLDPDTQASKGQNHLVALAGQWTVTSRSSIDIEFEHSVQRQPSMPGFSALGSVLPNAKSIDPATNLNQQPWTLPVELRGNTGSIRWQQLWEAGWKSVVTYGEQRLLSNDRTAFPFGCSNETLYRPDRFCSDGSFDLFDFRSDGERRTTRALHGQLSGAIQLGSQRHDINVGLLRNLHTTDIQGVAFNYSDAGSIYNPNSPVSAKPATSPDKDRHERSTELSLQDAITFNDQWHAWLGVRHTKLIRSSVPDDGVTPSTTRDQSITTPWAAMGYTLAPQTQAYVSWGEGAEVKTAPGASDGVTNSREVMPAIKSRQVEVGIKAQHEQYAWGASLFHIQRPEYGIASGLFQLDGKSTHQGLEGYWQVKQGAWGMNASAMLLHAKREGSSLGVNGLSPTNVPRYTLKWSGSYRLPANITQGLRTNIYLDVVNEGSRWADKDNTLRIPAWTRLDASMQAVQGAGNNAITWRLGVTNLLNTRAWRESPSSFGHIWLFPMAARTWTASAQIDF